MKKQSGITGALSLYQKELFWEYSEREIQLLPPEFVIPRVTRYGSLNDIIRLFCIYAPGKVFEVANNNKELDSKEKSFLNNLYTNVSEL